MYTSSSLNIWHKKCNHKSDIPKHLSQIKSRLSGYLYLLGYVDVSLYIKYIYVTQLFRHYSFMVYSIPQSVEIGSAKQFSATLQTVQSVAKTSSDKRKREREREKTRNVGVYNLPMSGQFRAKIRVAKFSPSLCLTHGMVLFICRRICASWLAKLFEANANARKILLFWKYAYLL